MTECNSYEALRAKEIAEKKFTAKDFTAAKRFALKAQNLDPALDGICQMISTLDVHIASEMFVNGERDWYSVLSVNASADDETVRRQYRKLALMLHPDKNKSVGAEAAFKLVSEAWNVLCDKSTRMVYDHKRGMSQSYSYPNGFARANKSSNLRNQKNAARVVADPSPVYPPRLDTFWTSCHHCRMQYEYLRVYINHNLLCPNCHGPFLATEIRNPITGHNPPASWSSSQWQPPSNHSRKPYRQRKNATSAPCSMAAGFQHGVDFSYGSGMNVQSSAFIRTPGEEFAPVHSQVRAAKLDREAPDRRGRRSILSSMDRPGKKQRGFNENVRANYGQNGLGNKNGICNENAVFGSHSFSQVENSNGSFVECDRVGTSHRQSSNLKKELSIFDIRNMLVKKAQTLVQKKLGEWASMAASAKSVEKKSKVKEKQDEKMLDMKKDTTVFGKDGFDKSKISKTGNHFKQVPAGKDEDILGQPSVNLNREVQKLKSIDVPDPDFHDFDKDRSERSFEPDQVWATYDDEDGMPRYYAVIQKVISLKPFKICMSFLNSKNNRELGPLNWVGKGFTKTCGDFRVGRYVTNDSINVFSHKVQWGRGVRGAIRIVPRKGDVWAIYRNWSPDWNELTPDDVIYKYDMMEVLDDYDEERGVAVVPLVKVAGFKTVFHKHMDPKEVRRIPREEMFRFSHQVPSYYLTGAESQDAPEGCHELDPAATPVDLLRVITEA